MQTTTTAIAVKGISNFPEWKWLSIKRHTFSQHNIEMQSVVIRMGKAELCMWKYVVWKYETYVKSHLAHHQEDQLAQGAHHTPALY